MSGIPYNELQDVSCTVNDTDGTKHTIATLHYAFVIPCRDCKFCMSYWGADYCDLFSHVTNDPDGFCAWGERKVEG